MSKSLSANRSLVAYENISIYLFVDEDFEVLADTLPGLKVLLFGSFSLKTT